MRSTGRSEGRASDYVRMTFSSRKREHFPRGGPREAVGAACLSALTTREDWQPRRSLEQQRRELRQVVAPVQPGMAALALDVLRREAMPLEQFDRGSRRLDQEIVLASAQPEQLEPLLGSRVVEHGEMTFLPGLAKRRGWCGRRRSTPSAATAAEHA